MPGDVDGMPRACSPAEILHNALESSELEGVPGDPKERRGGEGGRGRKEKEKRKKRKIRISTYVSEGKRSGVRGAFALSGGVCESELIRRGRRNAVTS